MQNSVSGQTEFETIVLGVGGMGSATCYELARRGVRVLGLDRFPLVHDQGSSHGESRIIRKAYFEHPDYVPLLHRSYELWQNLQQISGQTLFHPTGLLLSGPPEGDTIRGARLSAAQHGLELQNFTADAARQRFGGLEFPADHEIAFEPGAGTLFVDKCVKALVDESVKLRATLRGNEPALEWSSDGQSVRVKTAVNEYTAQNLVVTAGAWAGNLLTELGLSLKVLRKFVGWFPLQTSDYLAANGRPNYLFELPGGTFYGFPSFDGASLKLAEHSRGEPIDDPARVDRECHHTDVERLSGFIQSHLPGVGQTPVRHSVCLYTMSIDQHFVIDVHPQWKNVAFAAGFSGHGFKFCPVVGEALADLIHSGRTKLPIEFLAAQRGLPIWKTP